MATAPLRMCLEQGCSERVPSGRCEAHLRRQRLAHARHVSAPGVNYGRRWKRARAAFLAEHPLCVDCEAIGDIIPAEEVDHITPHRGDALLFWDASNWASRCKSCHSKKTAHEVLSVRWLARVSAMTHKNE